MKYAPEILKTFGNIVYTSDGSVWVTYVLRGAFIDEYHNVRSAALNHITLAEGLYSVGAPEWYIGGFEADVDVAERMNRYLADFDEFDKTKNMEFYQSLVAYRGAIDSSMAVERRRVYVLAVRMNTSLSIGDRVRASLLGKDVFGGATATDARKFSQDVFDKIPTAFKPALATGDVLHWVWNRARRRGLVNDPTPARHETAEGIPFVGGPVGAPAGGFPQVVIDEVAENDTTIEQFGEHYARGADDIPNAKKSLMSYFYTMSESRLIGVKNLDERTDGFVEGTSYQSCFAVTGYPTQEVYAVDSLATLADTYLGFSDQPQITCDWVQRIWYAPELEGNGLLNEQAKIISQEAGSNSETVMDEDEYANRARELMDFVENRNSSNNSLPIHVTTMFAYGGADRGEVLKYVNGVKSEMNSRGYRISWPTGGQTDLWRSMLPCSSRSLIVENLAGSTLVENWAQYVPIRYSSLGDGKGLPLGSVIDNTLNREVNINLITGTLSGNASLAVSGAQGRGKSYFIKKLVNYMIDTGNTCYVLDSQGEYAVFAQAKGDAQVIDMVNPTVSVDPLRLFAHKPRVATDMLTSLLLPMLGIKAMSVEGAALKERLNPAWLETRGITSTREFLEMLVSPGGQVFELKDVVPVINAMLSDPQMTALIDPRVNGQIQPLPLAKITSRLVVFVTMGLSMPDDPSIPIEDYTLAQRYTLMVNSAVAYLTEARFKEIPTACAFVLDEASFYEDLPVLSALIRKPDRTGRKFNNFVIAGSQTGSELSRPEYKLIRRRFAFGQDTLDNAREALDWAGFKDPVTGAVDPDLVDDLVTNTSPLDPENHNLPMVGRAGEAYYFDGSSRGKIQVYPEFRKELERVATTRSTDMIRYTS